MAKPRACDDEVPVDLAHGSGGTSGVDSPLANELLDATSLLTRVGVLLSEASADDWREVRTRLDALRGAIRSLPKAPPRRKRVGF